MATDYSKLSNEELLAGLRPRMPAAEPAGQAPATAAPGAGAAPAMSTAAPAAPSMGQAPAPAAPMATSAQPSAPGAQPLATRGGMPDFASMSNAELLAGLRPRIGAPDVGGGTDQPQRSAGDTLIRQAGLTARAGVQAGLAIPGMVSDAITGPINAGLDATMGDGNGFRFQRIQSAADNLMTGAGLPTPENATERVVQEAATAMGAGGASAAMARGVAGLARTAGAPVAQNVANSLAAGPGAQIIGGGASGGAAATVKEQGGGAGAQAMAGLAGAVLPSAAAYGTGATVRGLLRGGEAGRQQVADNVAAFRDAAGVNPTLGQATGSRTWQAAEQGLANVVGGAGVMARTGERQTVALQKAVEDLGASLAPNATGMEAGEAITRGVKAFRDGVKASQDQLYAELDRFIPPNKPIQVSRTQAALQDLNADIPGAEALSAFFKNSKISGIENALLQDMAAAGESGRLPWQAIKQLRTLVGNELADAGLASDLPRSKFRALYAALTDDLGDAATAAGPNARTSWDRATDYTRTSMQRLEELESIVRRDAPEKVFAAATAGMKEGGTTIKRVMDALPLENRREVAAAVLQKLGRANGGMQNEMGDAFSSETFLTNLAAVSPQARSALFGSSGFPGLEEKITQLGKMASTRREGARVFANPSGTARQAGMIGWAAALGTAIGTGNPGMILLALGAPAGTNLMARAATGPALVNIAAQRTQLAAGTGAAGLGALSRMAELPQEQPRLGLTGQSLVSRATQPQLGIGAGGAAATAMGAMPQAVPQKPAGPLTRASSLAGRAQEQMAQQQAAALYNEQSLVARAMAGR